MHKRIDTQTSFLPQILIAILISAALFSLSLGVFFPGASSWWEPIVGAGFMALTFGWFAFFAIKYPLRILPFWIIGILGLFFLSLGVGDGVMTECITADFCTSSSWFLSILYTTFSIDLALLIAVLPQFIVPYVLRRQGSVYMLLGGTALFFSGGMLYTYVTIASLAPHAYHLVVLSTLCIFSLLLFIAGIRYDVFGSFLQKHKKTVALGLFVGLLLLMSTVPFGE